MFVTAQAQCAYCSLMKTVYIRCDHGPTEEDAVSASFRADFRSLPMTRGVRWYLHLIRRNGRPMFTRNFPKKLCEFLSLDDEHVCTDLDAVTAREEVERVTRTRGKVLITFRLTLPYRNGSISPPLPVQ